jgi:monofunctional biosynthetic peptidoglycan transglycosylase
MVKWILKRILYLFVLVNLYLIACKWIWPPITIIQLKSFFTSKTFNRDYVKWNEISPAVKWAAIASEDQLFTSHSGFDWESIKKSFSTTSKKTKGTAASSISQQTAKNVFLWQGNGVSKYIRKIPEFYFTALIELVWGKKRILEVYLNTIEMGDGVFGIEAASKKYFNKNATQLTSKEAAMIIACLPNPKRFTIKPMSKRVAWRYPQILKQMELIKNKKNKQLIY